MAYLYNEGDLHSPRRDGRTRLVRIEGQNMEKVRRDPYERVAYRPGSRREAIIGQAAARGRLPRAFRPRLAHRRS